MASLATWLADLSARIGSEIKALRAEIVSGLGLKAPLASPALTGTPTAPTATAGTGTAQIATTAFVTAADALKANLSGATYTGNITVPNVVINGSAGSNRQINFNTGGVVRWNVHANTTAESGSNNGSNFVIQRYDDSGNSLGSVLNFVRSTGVGTFAARPVFGTATPWDTANFTPLTAMSGFCSGKPAASEVVGGAIFPTATTITQANCSAKATIAATASTVFTIAKDGTTVGTITFSASATTGTVSITAGSITALQHVTITAPSTPDATLANISFLVRA